MATEKRDMFALVIDNKAREFFDSWISSNSHTKSPRSSGNFKKFGPGPILLPSKNHAGATVLVTVDIKVRSFLSW